MQYFVLLNYAHNDTVDDIYIYIYIYILYIYIYIYILHYLKDPKLWDGIFLIMGNAVCISSTVSHMITI